MNSRYYRAYTNNLPFGRRVDYYKYNVNGLLLETITLYASGKIDWLVATSEVPLSIDLEDFDELEGTMGEEYFLPCPVGEFKAIRKFVENLWNMDKELVFRDLKNWDVHRYVVREN